MPAFLRAAQMGQAKAEAAAVLDRHTQSIDAAGSAERHRHDGHIVETVQCHGCAKDHARIAAGFERVNAPG